MNAENDLKMWLQRVADSPEKLRPVDVVMRLLDPEMVPMPNGCTLHGMVAWLMTQRVSDRVRTILVQWSAANPESVQAQPEVRGEHTPGPWKPTTLYGESTSEPFIVWCDGIGAAVAHVYTRSEMGLANRTTQVANARLIAAAPDLLGMLRTILMRLDLEPKSAVFPCSAMREDIRRVIDAATK